MCRHKLHLDEPSSYKPVHCISRLHCHHAEASPTCLRTEKAICSFSSSGWTRKHISRVSYMLLSKGSFCFPGFSLLRGSRSWLALCLWGFQLLILGRRPWPLQLATFLASDLSVSYLACVLILILAIASALFQGRVCSFETGDV